MVCAEKDIPEICFADADADLTKFCGLGGRFPHSFCIIRTFGTNILQIFCVDFCTEMQFEGVLQYDVIEVDGWSYYHLNAKLTVSLL